MATRLRILVQTTIPRRPDDWSIESLRLLRSELAAIDEAAARAAAEPGLAFRNDRSGEVSLSRTRVRAG